MRVEYANPRSEMRVCDVPVGDIFEHNGEHWMRLDTGIFNAIAVHLDGSSAMHNEEIVVLHVRAKLVIE